VQAEKRERDKLEMAYGVRLEVELALDHPEEAANQMLHLGLNPYKRWLRYEVHSKNRQQVARAAGRPGVGPQGETGMAQQQQQQQSAGAMRASSWSAPQPGMYPGAVPGQPLPFHRPGGGGGGGGNPGGHYMLAQEMQQPQHRQSSSLLLGVGDAGQRPYSAGPAAAMYDGGPSKLGHQVQSQCGLDDDPLMGVEIHDPQGVQPSVHLLNASVNQMLHCCFQSISWQCDSYLPAPMTMVHVLKVRNFFGMCRNNTGTITC
jgi:hypothetical protein